MVYVPLMKELGMSLDDIKATPRYELDGLLYALNTYKTIHAYDGYTPKDIGQMSKDKPEIRSAYNKSINMKRKYERLVGLSKPQKQNQSLSDVLKGN
tara:strand:- start:241 stop:531 length:291 start_codon:yes stop_codon:yes gene_type:complete